MHMSKSWPLGQPARKDHQVVIAMSRIGMKIGIGSICFLASVVSIQVAATESDVWEFECTTVQTTDEQNCRVTYIYWVGSNLVAVGVIEVENKLLEIVIVGPRWYFQQATVQVDSNEAVSTDVCSRESCIFRDSTKVLGQMSEGTALKVRVTYNGPDNRLEFQVPLSGFTPEMEKMKRWVATN
jgi:hypothetical protein